MGRVVHYVTPHAPPRAAIVGHLHGGLRVSLLVLLEGASHKPEETSRAMELWANGNGCLRYRGDVPHESEAGEHYPRAWREIPDETQDLLQ